MSAIRRLSHSTPSTSSQFPFYDPHNGQDRRCSGAELADMIQAELGDLSGYVTQYAAPGTSAFTVQVAPPADGANVFLLLMPAAGFASGTIAMPSVTQARDHQQVLVSSTAAVGALAVNGNGATVIGAPTSLTGGSSFCLQFDAVTQGWYIVSGSGTVGGGGGGGGAVSSVNGQTGDVIISKADVGLSAVDNLSFLAAMATAATMTNKGIDGSKNTLTNIPQSAITGLVGSLGGLVPTSRTITINGTTLDLTANRSWTISVDGLTDGNKGDITVSGTGTVWSINAASVTLGKMASLAANSVIANITGSAATPAAVSLSAFKSALTIGVADVAGSVIAVSSSRNMVAADNGATLTFSGAYTLTIPTGLTGISVIVFPPSSGNASIAAGAGVTINGGTSTITRSGTNPFSILAVGTNTYIVTDNTASSAVPTSRTITINGSAKDLSADRAWTVGMVPIGYITADSTITDSSASSQTLASFTLPANSMAAGDELLVRGRGSFVTSSTVAKTFGLSIGGTQFAVSVDSTNNSGGSFEFEGRLFARTTSSQLGSQRYQWGAPGINNNPPLSLTKDLTTSLTVAVTGQFGTSGSGTQSITLQVCTVHVIKGS